MPIAVSEEHESLRRAARAGSDALPADVPRALADGVATPGPRRLAGSPLWEKMAATGLARACMCPRRFGGEGFALAEVGGVVEELAPRPVPRPAPADAARVGRPGPARDAGGRPGSCGAWPTARSPPPWRSRPRPTDDPDDVDPTTTAARLARRRDVTLRGALRPVLGLPDGAARARARRRHVRLVPARPRRARRRRQRRAAGRARPHAAARHARVEGEVRLSAADQVLVPDDTVRSLAFVLTAAESARPGPLVPGHGVGLRQGPGPVRPPHRPVPGGEAQVGRHARGGRAVRRRRLGRRRRVGARPATATARARAIAAQRPDRRGGRAPWPRSTARSSASRRSAASASPGSTTPTSICRARLANLQLVAGGDVGAIELAVAGRGHGRRPPHLRRTCRPEAEALRAELAPRSPSVAAAGADDPSGCPASLAEAGLMVSHWPPPWGRDASPLEQLVIDDELEAAALTRPTWRSGPGPCRRSSPTAPTPSRNAGCGRRCSDT